VKGFAIIREKWKNYSGEGLILHDADFQGVCEYERLKSTAGQVQPFPDHSSLFRSRFGLA